VADDQQHTGGMIALIPRVEDAERMAVRGGEKPEELHLTLCYLGDDVTGWTSEMQNRVASLVADMAARCTTPLAARTMATATFNPDGYGDRQPCAVFLVGDSRDIGNMRSAVIACAGDQEQHEPFIPHITIGYGLKTEKLGDVGPVTFDRVRLALGDKVYDFPLGEEKALLMEYFEWKAKFTKADGGFGKKPAEGDTAPKIENEADLKKAAAVWRDSKSPKLRSHILKRASALKIDPPKDLADAGSKDAIAALFEGLSDVEISALVEQKVMSPSPNAAKLREYWAHGEGVKKWRPGTPGDFKRLRRHLAKYVHSPHILDGLTANIHKLATGEWPGPKAHSGKKDVRPVISAEEIKAAMLMADPDADLDDESLASLFDDDAAEDAAEDSDEDGDEDFDDAIDPFEQGLVDEVRWVDSGDGGIEREDSDDEDDPAENFEDDKVTAAPAGPRQQVSLWD
jgi:2'-5' RNA ligase